MKFAAINGSPHGSAGSTQVVLEAFLEGCREEGAQVVTVQLAELQVGLCRACHSCWTSSPGKCVIEDDLPQVLESLEGADFVVLASPLHFLQVSGNLKVFIDRLTSTGGNPHNRPAEAKGPPPRMAVVMSAGFPRPEQFRATSVWMEDLAALLGRELWMEAYAGGARRLPLPEAQPWLGILRDAGRRAARGSSLPAEARHALKAGF